jgi:hypothetical protein
MPEVQFSIVLDGKEVDLLVEAKVVDNGIGSYEYWGAKGTHHSYEVEWEIISTTPHIDPFKIWDDESLVEGITKKVETLLDRIGEEGEMGADRREED